ncbi:hypothetical protein ACFLWN_04335 [Chloroflexota bacterium]
MYSEKIKIRALELRKEDNNRSARIITDILCDEFPNELNPNKFSLRTVQLWLNEVKGKREQPTSDDVKEHDRQIFRKSNKIIDEVQLLSFLWPLDGEPPICYYDKGEKAEQFLRFFSYEGNQYIDPRLKSTCNKLRNALTNLGIFIFHEFRSPNRIDTGDEKYSRLIPSELAHMHYSGEGDMEDDPRYWEYYEELKKLQENCQSYVKQYRTKIRDLLLV